MDANLKLEVPKDMFNTGRRSAISTSELGLYSDHSEYYNSNTHGATVRKFVIGIMVVVSVILIGIFLYDFTSSATIGSKVKQETKHIYILQNSLRRSNNVARKLSVTHPPTIYIVNTNRSDTLEDRSDDDQNREFKENVEAKFHENGNQRMDTEEPESKTQNLNNFKIRSKMLDRWPDKGDPLEKQMVDNHATFYRVRNKLAEIDGFEETDATGQQATPFRFELKGPQPDSFKRPKYPQLTQYRYPHPSRNIQDIIKYLTNDPETLNRGIKFTGIYMNPKKFDSGLTDIGEVAVNSDGSEEQVNTPYAFALNTDPLYQYKPKHPTDVNLLATSNFRFSPVGMQRYNPYSDPYYQRLNFNKHGIYSENQYDSDGSFGTNYGKKRKPKPFSVMLDIYPITEATEQTKKSSRLKPQAGIEDYDAKRSLVPYLARYPKAYTLQAQPSHALAGQTSLHQVPEEDEKHQMILHLNLYPKRKTKLTRHEVIDRSQMASGNDREHLIEKLIYPFNALAKHLTDHVAVEEAKINDDELEPSRVRYEETSLLAEEPEQRRDIIETQAEKLIGPTTQFNGCEKDCGNSTDLPVTSTVVMTSTAEIDSSTTTTQTTTLNDENFSTFRDIDTIEGFQQFADSLIATD